MFPAHYCDYGVVVDSASDKAELQVAAPPGEAPRLGNFVLGVCGSSSWKPQAELGEGALGEAQPP